MERGVVQHKPLVMRSNEAKGDPVYKSKSGNNSKNGNSGNSRQLSSCGYQKEKVGRRETQTRSNKQSENRNEVGSCQRPGSKKCNIYGSAGGQNYDGAWDCYDVRRRSNPGHRKSCIVEQRSFFNKEQYVRAVCQFAVFHSDLQPTSIQHVDVALDWNRVQELRLYVDSLPTCPICLCDPVAAQMTCCGHVYCWPCILHYLALSDKPWRKCPICFESIYKNQLRSARLICRPRVQVNDLMTFVLMKRARHSAAAFPCAEWTCAEGPNTQTIGVNDELSRWCKSVGISVAEVKGQVLGREMAELETQLADLWIEDSERVFILEAIEALKERESMLTVMDANISAEPSDIMASSLSAPNLPLRATDFQPVCFEDAFENIHKIEETRQTEESTTFKEESINLGEPPAPLADDHDQTELAPIEAEKNHGEIRGASARKRDNHNLDDYYYFYQASDGQHVFLHPMNVRCLAQEYGSLGRGPWTVSGRVVEQESWTMDPGTRHWLKPLAHLPLTSQFTLVELKFDRGILSRGTLDTFADELQRRRDNRRRRQYEERRQDRRAEHWHQQVMIQSRGYSCPGGLDSFEAGDVPVVTLVGSAQKDIEREAPPPPSEHGLSASPNDEQTALSFAQMLRLGRRRNPDLPSAAQGATPVVKATAGGGDNNSDEDSSHAPAYQDSFGSALAKALDTMKQAGEGAGGGSAETTPRGKKNKRPRGKVIFST